ncbi:hypothetical protein N0V94_005705 [Neodidymelliopsis sp. IMI 364377]|nr:hypothetical protein N0V94_005705 [Neodidymelliopsis sp. IMI 364377]
MYLGQDQGGRLDLTAYYNSLNRTLDNRIFISMIDFHFPPNEDSEITGMWINQITSMLCKSTYSINQYLVEYHQNSTRSTMDFVKKQDTTLSDFYDGDISRGVYNVFRDYEGMYLGMGGSDFVLSDAVPAFFQMIKTLNGGGNFTLKNLMDPNVLKANVESLMTGTAIQLLHMNIMTELSHGSDNTFQGTLTYIDKLLHVKAISTGFLCAGFAILTILCVTLLFIIPRRPSFKPDMGSVLVVAETLRASPKLAEQFSDHVCNNASSIIRTQKYLSHTSPTSALTIEGMLTSSADGESITKPVPRPTKAKNIGSTSWWYPASARTWFTAVAVILSIIIIGVLEGIQQISDKRQGFVAIRNIDIGTTVLAQYVPAAVALSINLMFGSIELVVAATIPFATLRKGNAVASRSLAIDYLTKSGPHLFIRSLANKHLALNVILLTTFVASFLSIVIPGLYSHITIPSTADITILQMDRFDPSGIDISFDDKSAAVMLNLLTYYGIEYPGWAFDNLAIPEFSLPSVATELHESSDPTSAIVSFKTDALRAKLHCENVTARKNWTVEPYAYAGPSRGYSEWVSVTSSMELPWSLCSNPPKNISTGSAVTWYVTTYNI